MFGVLYREMLAVGLYGLFSLLAAMGFSIFTWRVWDTWHNYRRYNEFFYVVCFLLFLLIIFELAIATILAAITFNKFKTEGPAASTAYFPAGSNPPPAQPPAEQAQSTEPYQAA